VWREREENARGRAERVATFAALSVRRRTGQIGTGQKSETGDNALSAHAGRAAAVPSCPAVALNSAYRAFSGRPQVL
jgi:hypothetical protein